MCESLLIKFRSTYSWATSIKPFLYWISTWVKVLCLLIWLKCNEKVITIHKSLLKVKLINVPRKWRMKYGCEMQQILIANNDLRKEGSILYLPVCVDSLSSQIKTVVMKIFNFVSLKWLIMSESFWFVEILSWLCPVMSSLSTAISLRRLAEKAARGNRKLDKFGKFCKRNL